MNNKLPITQAIDEFIASAESDKTKQSYRTALNHFSSFLITRSVSPADDVQLIELHYLRDFSSWLSSYRNEMTSRPLSKNTRSLYLMTASLFIRRLIIDRRITHIDQRDYDNLRGDIDTRIKRDPIKKKLPADDLVNAILKLATIAPKIDPDRNEGDRKRAKLSWLRNRAIVYCLHSSGARVGELVNLVRGDLREDEGIAWVMGKGDKAREVYLSKQAWEYLNAYLEERNDSETELSLSSLPVFCRHDRGAGKQRRMLSTRSVENLIADLANQTELVREFHIHPHSFRHYFATNFLRHTGNLALTQDALGHTDPATTRVYADTDKKAIKKAHGEMFNGE